MMSDLNITPRLCPSPNNIKMFQCTEQANNISKKLQTFYENQEFFDIVLIAGIDKVKLQAHRFALGASSDYFLAMFRSNLLEAKADEIELKQVDPETLKHIIDFMYTGSIELRCETVESVLRVADFLQMNTLIIACCEFLGEQLEASNCLGIAYFAEEHSYSILYRKAYTFACMHFEKVCTEEEFFHLNEQQFRKFLSSDDLCVASENLVFLSLVAWVEYDKENREKLLLDLLSHIRFTLLTSKFIIENRHAVCKTIECYELVCSWLQWHLSPRKRSRLPPAHTKERNATEKVGFVSGYSTTDLKIQTFNPDSNSWSSERLLTPSSERSDYGAKVVNRKLIIAGGKRKGKITNSVKCLDLQTMKWTNLPPMKQARKSPAMADLNGDLYVVGGYNRNWLSAAERYNFSTGEWQEVAPLKSQFEGITIAVRGKFLYAAGNGGTTMECYDPAANKWTQKTFKNEKSDLFGFSAVGDYLYAVGGVHNGTYSKTVERYLPSTDTWTTLSSLTVARSTVLCAALNQRLIVCGGFSDGVYSDLVEEYNPTTDEWNTLAPLLSKDIPNSIFTT